jgi:hypothetical protein
MPDLLFGCGLLYVLVIAAHAAAGPALRQATPLFLLPLLSLLFSSPHYGATLVRAYEQRRDRRAYVLFTVWATLVLAALFAVALASPLVGAIAFTLYLTWSPWHYSGQNYGLAVMFLGRRGAPPSPNAKRWMHATFQLSFLLTALVMHMAPRPGYSPSDYSNAAGVLFVPIGIAREVGVVLMPLVASAYVVSLAGTAWLLRRKSSWVDLAPVGALALTQAVWFVAPYAVSFWGWRTGLEPFDSASELTVTYTLLLFVGHGIQYLWVTAYYARAAHSWRGYSRYALKVAAAGIAIWTLPAILLGPPGVVFQAGYVTSLALLIAAFVNLHHFILDGAIWKLRHSRVAAVLIRSTEEDAETGASERAKTWRGAAAWTAAGAGLLAGVAGFCISIYVPSAIGRGDLLAASNALSLSGWLGPGEWEMHRGLARRFEEQGDFTRTLAHARTWATLNPTGQTHAYLGRIEARAGNREAARRAYEAAAAAYAASGRPEAAARTASRARELAAAAVPR